MFVFSIITLVIAIGFGVLTEICKYEANSILTFVLILYLIPCLVMSVFPITWGTIRLIKRTPVLKFNIATTVIGANAFIITIIVGIFAVFLFATGRYPSEIFGWW